MTPQDLQKLIAFIQQQQQSGSPTAAAAPAGGVASTTSLTPKAATTGIPGLSVPGLGAGAPFGIGDPSGSGSTAGGIGGAVSGGSTGAQLGSLGGPWGTAIGGVLGALLGGLGGGGVLSAGVPRSAKTEALGSALSGSGNTLDELIGQFVNTGSDYGQVLSSASFAEKTRQLSQILEALSGEHAPSVTGTGAFSTDPTLKFPGIGGVAKNFALPAGYQFQTDPNALAQAYQDIVAKIRGGGSAQADWKTLIPQLIAQGDLTKYAGPTGAVGATGTKAAAVPNVSLPHPLTQQNPPGSGPTPYPL